MAVPIFIMGADMTLQDLKTEIIKNNINEEKIRVDAPYYLDPVLTLMKDQKEAGWRIISYDKNILVENEFFCAQHDACRYFLKCILSEPWYRKNYDPAKYESMKEEAKILLQIYGFE
ncbi:MAG TPA: hypothetical protein PKB02_08320 [Anaerohalosphaeraceae bacterium]|nr:hypothetical protein [Anaerohalosphaeraceae bacterium]